MPEHFPIIKICGNPSLASVRHIQPLQPHWWGFIFYPLSKRYFRDVPACLRQVTQGKKVGVFVNASYDETMRIAEEAGLDYLQLHGDESPEYCAALSKHYPIIKAFGVSAQFNMNALLPYESYVRYFLFDTQSPLYGGTGKPFDRTLITETYTLQTPFFFSGGVDITEALSLLASPHRRMIGLDMNSKLETAPGEKNNPLIQSFLQRVYAL